VDEPAKNRPEAPSRSEILGIKPTDRINRKFKLSKCGSATENNNYRIPSEYNGKLGWISFDTGSSRINLTAHY
jgi:hypothetical protein